MAGEHLVDSFILEEGSVEEISGAIETVAMDHELRCRLTRTALEKVAFYSVEQQVAQALRAIGADGR